uniref:SV_SVC-Lyc-2 n=1 Tax=Lychas buchari TaxID=1330406 RepID=T1E7N8_9SCOR
MYKACVEHFKEVDFFEDSQDQCLVNDTVRYICQLCDRAVGDNNAYLYCCNNYLESYEFCEEHDYNFYSTMTINHERTTISK